LTTFTIFDHFLAGTKLWLFDADGTLRRCTVPGQPCPNKPGEWELIPEAVEFLRLINWDEAEMAIVSNQGGVELGYLSGRMAEDLLQDLCDEIAAAVPGVRFADCPYDLCTTADRNCYDRKPNPGMLAAAMAEYAYLYEMSEDVGKAKTVMVGDRLEDRDAARNAGVRFCWAQELFGISS
jgi:HAD superfamily hydrolase (TIGR01662 family)